MHFLFLQLLTGEIFYVPAFEVQYDNKKCLKTRSCKCGDLYEFRSQKIFELGVFTDN